MLPRRSVWIALTAVAFMATPAPGLVGGDRLVFLGDSITAGNAFTRDVEAVLRLRHPELALTVINAGISGHSAIDGLKRVEHDVLRYRPTWVFLNFGMNDAGYSPGAVAAAHERHMSSLLDRVASAGARAVWLEPTPFDVRGLPAGASGRKREENILRYVAFSQRTGRARGVPVVPLHGLLTEAMSLDGRRDRPGPVIPDRVHPSPSAHALMAAAILEAMGEPLDTSRIDAAWLGDAVMITGAPNHFRASWDGKLPLELDLTGVKAPVPILTDDSRVGGLMAAKAAALGRLEFRLSGLPPGQRYRLRVGTAPSRLVTGEELARGIDLMAGPRGPRPQGAADAACAKASGHPFWNDFFCVRDLVAAKDRTFETMRSDRAKKKPRVALSDEAVADFLAAWNDGYATQLAAEVTRTRAAPHRLSLTPAEPPRAPSGPRRRGR
jgi:lysophospholipase L1-like esterase